jgi:hypothetical protein
MPLNSTIPTYEVFAFRFRTALGFASESLLMVPVFRTVSDFAASE